jgi:hypothetical protein
MPPAQRVNRRATLGRTDQRLVLAGSTSLEPSQERVDDGQLIDAATTLGTITQVGGNAGQLPRGKPSG